MSSSGTPPRILVLILSSPKSPWIDILRQGQRQTWMKQSVEGIQILAYFGVHNTFSKVLSIIRLISLRTFGPEFNQELNKVVNSLFLRKSCRITGDEIFTKVPEGLLATTAKTMVAFKACMDLDFDYIVRTNTSSYLHLERMAKALADKPRQSFYAGPLGIHGNIRYASGTCIILSRDLFETLSQTSTWDLGLVDDISIGKILNAHGVFPVPIDRFEFTSLETLSPITADSSVFLFRCKELLDGKRLDIRNMRRLDAFCKDANF
jgi:hypothetical protein